MRQTFLRGGELGVLLMEDSFLLGKNGGNSRNAAKIPYFCVKF